MADNGRLIGGCNCGSIRYEISALPLLVAACHCVQCRRQSGAAFSVNLIVPASAMRVEGHALAWEDTNTASGSPLTREYCGRCGSPIRSVPSATPKLVAVKAGTLDDPSNFAPAIHIWTRSKLQWVTIPDYLPSFEEGPPT